MPCLLLQRGRLVKTTSYRKPVYLGDPINSARIFNQMEVDELVLLDIGATSDKTPVNFDLVERIVSECFMPIMYGGGVKSVEDFRRLFRIGVEKVSVSSLLFDAPKVVREAVSVFGSQSVVATLDIRQDRMRTKRTLVTRSGGKVKGMSLEQAVDHAISLGVGEVVAHDVTREGTWSGFDCELIRSVADRCPVPVVAMGGAGSIDDIATVTRQAGVSAVAVGSMAVFQARGMGVLISFPSLPELEEVLP